MRPTLEAGDHLLVAWGARPWPGRLVIVRLPGRGLAVKRAWRRRAQGWWVERDNPLEGVDSWQVGAISGEDVLGVVVCRYWPPPGSSRRSVRFVPSLRSVPRRRARWAATLARLAHRSPQ